MNTKDLSDVPDHNTDYASQWIDYLKKKNTVLNIIWPLLLVTTICASLAAFYFFQLSSNANTMHKKSSQQVQNTQSELETLQGAHQALNEAHHLALENNTQLEDKLALILAAKTQLELQKGDSVSQLDLSSQIVDTLKEKLSALNEEKTLMLVALKEAKALLLNQEKNYQSKFDNLNAQTEESAKARFVLTKKLSDRKVAFKALMNRQKEIQVEMMRLADVVTQQNVDINKGLEQKKVVQQKLKDSQANLVNLQGDYKALEDSMKLAVAPINSPTQASSRSKAVVNGNIDGLDEIKVPVKAKKVETKKQKSKENTAFEFEKIRLENP